MCWYDMCSNSTYTTNWKINWKYEKGIIKKISKFVTHLYDSLYLALYLFNFKMHSKSFSIFRNFLCLKWKATFPVGVHNFFDKSKKNLSANLLLIIKIQVVHLFRFRKNVDGVCWRFLCKAHYYLTFRYFSINNSSYFDIHDR